ncbi:hypothetical protein GF361_03025 [Candidatus Woesearchaeota archaeon]|nr:hypothetical protein [Candidatus Woesearchaeota archaeon]
MTQVSEGVRENIEQYANEILDIQERENVLISDISTKLNCADNVLSNEDYAFWMGKAHRNMERENYLAARRCYLKAIEVKPGEVAPRLELSEICKDYHFNANEAADKLEEWMRNHGFVERTLKGITDRKTMKKVLANCAYLNEISHNAGKARRFSKKTLGLPVLGWLADKLFGSYEHYNRKGHKKRIKKLSFA